MSLNRAQIRLKIRELIQDFYDLDTVGSGGISASSETLPVTTIARYNVGDTLIIDSEHAIVREISSDDSPTVTITRGFQLTTGAIHSEGATIIIRPEFTDRALNQVINSAIADTYPDIWLEILDETLETDTDTREYDFPAGFSFIRRIQVENSEGHFIENRNWQLIGTKIQFIKDFSESGRTIRVIGQWYQPYLTDDSTTLEISDEQAEYVIYKAAILALEMRLGPRLKATEYSASVNDRAGQPNDMINMYSFLRRETDAIRRRESKAHIPGYMMRPTR